MSLLNLADRSCQLALADQFLDVALNDSSTRTAATYRPQIYSGFRRHARGQRRNNQTACGGTFCCVTSSAAGADAVFLSGSLDGLASSVGTEVLVALAA